ncbi:hypothetical protein KM043_013254 [Ampulex compressa]|nr:hypothetical protein KM043_013254 [Ampulex compressa]
MQTVLCEFEALLNSRPLIPLNEDPNDLVSHPDDFVVGDTLNSSPCCDLTGSNNAGCHGQACKELLFVCFSVVTLATQANVLNKSSYCKAVHREAGRWLDSIKG